ncbi:hypothetical protein [Brachybacterium kimchii]|uniref:Bacterial Pleckstrin homology domain-containing protein n=1 Tax=Brachybacterium kimchii TaxID=2942909 RepID=A0ABY4N9C7_9MICO|nr:hypothetical protein [Brachybacterium kimchii]UQN31155.1 hypothetical protein M4486_07700 [Brachybacterium kimchii]
MSRPEAPFHVGRTTPGAVGWTRIGMSAVIGVGIAGYAIAWARGETVVLGLVLALAVLVYAFWSWMRLATRFVVDVDGVTVSLGGFLPRPAWPVADFRTVQLRRIPGESLGVTVGGLGWRRGRVIAPESGSIEALPGRKVFTTGEQRSSYRLMVSRPGTLVEIIGREGTHFLLSPDDPRAAAEAIDQAIRARR